MTKQEEIREGFAAHLLSYMIPHYKNNPELVKLIIDELFAFFHSQDVVIRGESLGASHPHLADYLTVENLVEKEIEDENR